MRKCLVIIFLSLAACQTVKKQEVTYKPLPIYLPEFNGYIKDYIPMSKARTEDVLSEADYIYCYILKKLVEVNECDITKLVEGEAPLEKLVNEPSKYRGKVFLVYGKIADLYKMDFAKEEVGYKNNGDSVHIGVIICGDQPVVFHLAQKPDVVYLDKDNVSLEGIFIKLVKAKDRNIPFFMAKTIKRL